MKLIGFMLSHRNITYIYISSKCRAPLRVPYIIIDTRNDGWYNTNPIKYNIRKNWIDAASLIAKRPIVLMPFVIIAFLEALALEILYFSPRFPVSLVMSPVVRKFFGEQFIHYPGNFLLLPKIFYYAQVIIYVSIGVFLTSIAVQIVKNIKEKLPLKPRALIQNAAKRYLSLFLYGIIVIVMLTLAQKTNQLVLSKAAHFIASHFPKFPPDLLSFATTVSTFLSSIIIQAFLVLTIPIIVIEKRSFLKSLIKSLYLGFCNFPTVFTLIFLPFLVYLPVSVMKSFSAALVDKTFPEMSAYVTVSGIIISVILDCFIITCMTQFFLDTEKNKK